MTNKTQRTIGSLMMVVPAIGFLVAFGIADPKAILKTLLFCAIMAYVFVATWLFQK